MIIKTLDSLLNQAIQLNASDLHFEPQKNGAVVRIRIDGLLQEALKTNKETLVPLISRIKVLSHLDLAEKRLPQDGRIFMEIEGQRVDLRISTLPTIYGEKAVIRILNQNSLVKSLVEIKMPSLEHAAFCRMLAKKHGIILVSGPTGSGKTTTLYAALQKLNQTAVNIITIEDPVEYSLDGISQIHVNEKIGMTFERGLRAILRQDPDIIMVGEIRDRETARIAITAALTGHLVLSTIHTNDCISSISRLVDMGIEPYLIAGALVGLVSQRLVRKSTATTSGGVSVPPPTACGRQAIFEVLEIDEELRGLITRAAPKDKLTTSAQARGMRSLLENGLALCSSGTVAREELSRVLSE
ncbi:MAG: GspE/PulE family protein [Candidatus Margulisiibacteriota bacterium]